MAKRTRNVRSCEAQSSTRSTSIFTVANLAPITGAGREQLACFFRGLSFNAPWLCARDVHGGVEGFEYGFLF